LISFVTLIISLVILDIDPFLNIRALLGLLLLFLFFLFVGITIGLFVKTVGATTVYLLPIMFLFGFTPMIEFLGLNENGLPIKIASYFPIMQLIKMHDNQSWLPLGIVFLWLLAAIILAYVCFKKTEQDE